MVDGVRVQTDSLGSLTQTDIPLSQIDRIEILRGNAGALYGDAAIGGVIHIFTRKGKGQLMPYGAVSYGTYNMRDLSVGYGGEMNGKNLDLNAAVSKSDGFSSMNKKQNTNTNPSDNGYSKNSFSMRVEDQLTERLRLGVRLASTRSDTSYDKNDANAYALKSINDTVSAYARQQFSDAWFSSLDLTRSQLQYADMKNGNPYPLTSYTSSYLTGTQDALRWANSYEITTGHNASAGIDVLRDSYYSSGNYGYKIHRYTKGYYGGISSAMHNFTFQANIRRDQIDLDNTANVINTLSSSNIAATSTLLGVGYRLDPVWKLTGTASTGFRAPTAYDISTNTAVKQEEFKSEEAGVVYADASAYGRLVYFRTHTSNAIAYVDGPAPDYLTTAQNIGETKNSGVEATYRTNWRGHSIKISAVQQDPWSVSDNERLARRAHRYGSADVSRYFSGYELGAHLYAAGERKDSHYNTHMLAGYSMWSFSVSRKIDNEWTTRIKLDNAFNRDYQLAYGYNPPGRGIYATLQYQPK